MRNALRNHPHHDGSELSVDVLSRAGVCASAATLLGAVCLRVLWYRPAGDAAPAALETGRQTRQPGAGAINPFSEWVYNAAEMDRSKVLWAREMDPADNAALLEYYRDRKE